jgi:hypothetical protein
MPDFRVSVDVITTEREVWLIRGAKDHAEARERAAGAAPMEDILREDDEVRAFEVVGVKEVKHGT